MTYYGKHPGAKPGDRIEVDSLTHIVTNVRVPGWRVEAEPIATYMMRRMLIDDDIMWDILVSEGWVPPDIGE